MIIFVAWPTANVGRSNENAKLWHNLGYKVAVATDLPSDVAQKSIMADVPPLCIKEYRGYYDCMNHFARLLVKEMKADIVVMAGDGIMPHEGVRAHVIGTAFACKFPNGYGIMQPVGGAWTPTEQAGGGSQAWAVHKMHQTRRSDQRCESPWVGRTLIMEAENKNVYYPGYHQYFGDHELHDVAEKVGCLWKNHDLHQMSMHWSAGMSKAARYQITNFERFYENDLALYRTRRARDFPAPIITEVDGVDPKKLVLP